jgi:hypothetical protein
MVIDMATLVTMEIIICHMAVKRRQLLAMNHEQKIYLELSERIVFSISRVSGSRKS